MGTYLKDSASPNTCVATCPDGYFGNKLTGKCEACAAPCTKCEMKANRCTACTSGYNFLQAVNK